MSDTDEVVFKFPANVTITNSSDLHEQLKEIAVGTSDIRLDASEVEKIDTAGLQLIFAFIRSYMSKEKMANNIDMSAELKQAMAGLGIEEWIYT